MVQFVLPSSPVFIGVMFEYQVLSFVTLLTKSQFHIDGCHYHLPDMPSVVESTTSRSLNILNIPGPQRHGVQMAAHASGGQSNINWFNLHILRTQLLRTLCIVFSSWLLLFAK
jgi:hypothetical protein